MQSIVECSEYIKKECIKYNIVYPDDQSNYSKLKQNEKKLVEEIQKKKKDIDMNIQLLINERSNLLEQEVIISEKVEKNIRYLDYAEKYNINVDMNSLIDDCNSHRNDYIAQKAYKEWLLKKTSDCVGYSECYKKNFDCNGKMNYSGYDYAECECGDASWFLVDKPDKECFDISSVYAVGKKYGLSFFYPTLNKSDF